MTRTTVHLPDSVKNLIEGLADESALSPEVPRISQSEVIRLLLRTGANQLLEGNVDGLEQEDLDDQLDPETVGDLVPDHKQARYLLDEVKDESWLLDMRQGFEGRVRTELEKRSRNGYDPDGIREFYEKFAKEATIYWKIVGDDDERFEEAIEYVEQQIEEKAEQAEDFEPGDLWVSQLTGDSAVEIESNNGEDDPASEPVPADEIWAEARRRIEQANRPSLPAIATTVSKVTGADESRVREIIDQADSATLTDTETPADD